MTRTADALAWITPFHEAAGGVTRDALDRASEAFDDAPEGVRHAIVREGLRALLHAGRRTAMIRVNGDAETLPLFVAMTDPDGVVVHRPRPDIAVGAIAAIVKDWKRRSAEAARELAWWTHQQKLADAANAGDDETLRHVWARLGLDYRLFIGSAEEGAA